MNQLIRKKFYFLRHGKTDWNHRNLCQGQTDIPLNQSGKEEAERVCESLGFFSFSKIYTSPLQRALETAQIIQSYSRSPLIVIDELKERYWGTLEGATSAKMYDAEEKEEKDPTYIACKRMESKEAFKSRVLRGINLALNGETPLIVSHGRVFHTLCAILDVPLIKQIPNSSIIECVPEDANWKLIFH